MRLTNKQRADIESIRYFIPKMMRDVPITDTDIEQFFALSEKGAGENRGGRAFGNGFAALTQGKRWREWHMRAWEQSLADETLTLSELIDDMPRVVVNYMKKSLSKGMLAEQIEKLYTKNSPHLSMRGEPM